MRAYGERVLGALGGPWTFGGQAAADYLEAGGGFASVSYVPTVGELYAALHEARLDAICVPDQTLRRGFHTATQAALLDGDPPLYVLGDVAHAYHCSLLVRDPEVSLGEVVTVLGHTGSVSQCGPWLAEHMPTSEVIVVNTNSLEAARTVLEGDGTVASVGTPSLAEELGLHEAARDIDGGSTGNYWALATAPAFVDKPDRLIVTGRFDRNEPVGDLVVSLNEVGARLVTAYARPSSVGLFEYDFVMRFEGASQLAEIEAHMAAFRYARLAGAYTAHLA